MKRREINSIALNSRRFCIKQLKSKNIYFYNGKALYLCRNNELDVIYRKTFGESYKIQFAKNSKEKLDLSLIKKSSPASRSFVYFFINEEYGFCKIGTSINPYKRLSGVQTGCPFPISIGAIMYGNEEQEKLLHKKFKHLKSNGEWFFLKDDLVTYIKMINENKIE